ncbi:MAG: HAMP domain-containing histidine kinase [Myxococcales bacterium]|nr:HAMP domain-containing histidine kinase [Myxococcales bacterium]
MAVRTRRERVLTFFFVPALVFAVVVLLGVTFRNSFQLEKLREQSVVEATLTLANEKADRLDKRIIEQDNAVLSLVDVTDRGDFGATWLSVAARQTPTISNVFLVDLDSKQREVVAFASRVPALDAEAERRLFVRELLPDLELGEPRGQLRHLHKTVAGQSHLLSYWQREVRGRDYLLVAWHDVPRVVHDLFPTLYAERDQNARLNVVDESSRIVFGPNLSRGSFTLGRRFETTLYKWQVNVTLVSAAELTAAVARRRSLEMALVGTSWLVVLVGLTVVLVAAARERKLSNLKSDFVANVSHELKTPLSLVRMFGELLQSGRVENDEKRQQYLQIIVSESERLGSLIENVLDFAKVERGKAAYQFAPANVKDVVSRAVEACRIRAQREQIELVLEVSDDLPTTEIDEGAIEIAIINLIDNAIKYAPDGERVLIAAHPTPAHIEIRVTDSGAGILPEDRKRIFERFERGRGTQSKQIRGSGIGLALVKHIAEAHGGRAWCEVAEPRGSTFILTLRVRNGGGRERSPVPREVVA